MVINIIFQLYGIEELKEYGTWEKMKVETLNTANIEDLKAIKICNNHAIAIETAIYFKFGESIQVKIKFLNSEYLYQNKNYKNKFKTLLLNLMDSRNHELRFSILNGDLPAAELVKLSSEDLAPKKIKNMRVERQNKYFNEQVLMKDEMKIIAKTHKGESLLNVENLSDSDSDLGNYN